MPPWDGPAFTPLPAKILRFRIGWTSIQHMYTPLRDDLAVDSVECNIWKQRPGALAHATLACGGVAPRQLAAASFEYRKKCHSLILKSERTREVSDKCSAIETYCTCTPSDDRLIGLKLGVNQSKQAMKRPGQLYIVLRVANFAGHFIYPWLSWGPVVTPITTSKGSILQISKFERQLWCMEHLFSWFRAPELERVIIR